MKKPDPLTNLRRWAALEAGNIKFNGLAKQVSTKAASPLSASMLNRILTENLEQQREPKAKLLPFILEVCQKYSFNPEVNYCK